MSEQLSQQTCEVCRVGAPKVEGEAAQALLAQLDGWQLNEVDGITQLVKQYSFNNFVKALAFTNQVGELAESFNHHPAITTEWGKVTLSWWTHKIKGVHKNDFVMAAKSDDVLNDS